MLTCGTAQSASILLKTRTWLVLGVLLGAHIAGYAIISTQVQARFA